MSESEQQFLISHFINPESVGSAIKAIITRIQNQGDKPQVTVKQQLEIVDALSRFDLGRFILMHRGLNGYWTNYVVTHPWFGRKTGKNNRGEPFSELESFLLNRAPASLATQQRFEIFLQENQKRISENMDFAAIPAGDMGELLYLDYSDIRQFKLTGIDYDSAALDEARIIAESQGLSSHVNLMQQNAWDLRFNNEFDLISSSGLTIYEPDDKKVLHLYQLFYQALKPGGYLVTSFVTPSPKAADKCPWDMTQINLQDLKLQQIIFSDILDVKWQSGVRTEFATRSLLQSAGFREVKFIYDQAKIFPTVVALKPKLQAKVVTRDDEKKNADIVDVEEMLQQIAGDEGPAPDLQPNPDEVPSF